VASARLRGIVARVGVLASWCPAVPSRLSSPWKRALSESRHAWLVAPECRRRAEATRRDVARCHRRV